MSAMTEEEDEAKRALAAFRAMRDGGRKGGRATGAAKKRSSEHYARASTKAALGRAKSRGERLFSIHYPSGEEFARVIAPDAKAARIKGAAKLKREQADAKVTAREIKA